MNLAKVTSKGQITIPLEVRKQMGIKEGSKIIFVQDKDRFYIMNSSMYAMKLAQQDFLGVAEEIGYNSEADVVNMIKEMRKERK